MTDKLVFEKRVTLSGVAVVEMNELFRMALGLAEPWTISKVEFSTDDKQLDLWIDFPAGGQFACPTCGTSCSAYDTTDRTWRHLNFFEHKTLLHARQPRIECEDHGVKTVDVPWARPSIGFTLLMEAFIMALLQNGMTPKQVSRIIGEHDTRIWRVLQHYVDQSRAQADFSDVKAIAIDETSRRKGHHYITVFTGLNGDGARVLFACEGKNAATVEAFKEDLEVHGGEPKQIEEACLDMSAAFIAGLKKQFPQTELTFDNFHVMQLLGKAVDEVRRQEQKTHPELKGTRYIWLKNEWNRTESQVQKFDELRQSKLATVRATHMRNVFQDIFACGSIEEAEPMLKQWYFWATHSKLKPMIRVAKTIKKHWDGVLRWFKSRLTNGVAEAINGLIQSAKRKSRGFRNNEYLITMVYLIAGKLKFDLPAVTPVTHTK